MFSFLNNKLDILGSNNFKILGPFTSFLSDIVLIIYINQVLLSRLISDQLIFKMAEFQSIPFSQLTPDYINMVKNALTTSLSFAFVCILIYNLIIYGCAMKDYTWAKKYVKGYAFSAVFLSFFELVGVFYQTKSINLITVITTLLYFFVFYGYKYFMKKEEL